MVAARGSSCESGIEIGPPSGLWTAWLVWDSLRSADHTRPTLSVSLSRQRNSGAAGRRGRYRRVGQTTPSDQSNRSNSLTWTNVVQVHEASWWRQDKLDQVRGSNSLFPRGLSRSFPCDAQARLLPLPR